MTLKTESEAIKIFLSEFLNNGKLCYSTINNPNNIICGLYKLLTTYNYNNEIINLVKNLKIFHWLLDTNIIFTDDENTDIKSEDKNLVLSVINDDTNMLIPKTTNIFWFNNHIVYWKDIDNSTHTVEMPQCYNGEIGEYNVNLYDISKNDDMLDEIRKLLLGKLYGDAYKSLNINFGVIPYRFSSLYSVGVINYLESSDIPIKNGRPTMVILDGFLTIKDFLERCKLRDPSETLDETVVNDEDKRLLILSYL